MKRTFLLGLALATLAMAGFASAATPDVRPADLTPQFVNVHVQPANHAAEVQAIAIRDAADTAVFLRSEQHAAMSPASPKPPMKPGKGGGGKKKCVSAEACIAIANTSPDYRRT